jgi:hypothetical protein
MPSASESRSSSFQEDGSARRDQRFALPDETMSGHMTPLCIA